MDLLTTKVIVAIALGTISLMVGVLPVVCSRRFKRSSDGSSSLSISCLNCFAAGVILTTALANMLPEVNVFLEANYKNGLLIDRGLPLAEIWTLCGFFLIFLIEEVTHVMLDWCTKRNRGPVENGRARDSFGAGETGRMLPAANKHPHHHPQNRPQEQAQHHQHGSYHEDPHLSMIGSGDGIKAAMNGFLMVLAISLHELIEGVAVGLAGSQKSVWLYFTAISSHKYIISFCISLQLVNSGLKPLLSVLYISVFSFVSTIGTFIGVALSQTVSSEEEAQTVTVTVLQGIATGSLLYVAFLEVLEKERQRGTSGLIQIVFIVMGFLCMFGLMFVEHQGGGTTDTSSNSTADFTLSSFSDQHVNMTRGLINSS